MPPRGRSLGQLCWEARPAGRRAVPEGAREGRTSPTGFPRNANGPAGVTGQQQPPRPPTPGVERGAAGCAMAVRRQGAAGAATFESGGPQRRSFHAAGGWRNPMALLVAAGAVCRFGAPRFGEHGAVWAIRKFPSTVHGYQSPIPRLARTAVGVPTNRPRSIDAAHDLEDDVSARLRGSGRDQTVMAARSRTDRQPGWMVSPP